MRSAQPVHPFLPVTALSLNAQQASDDLLDIEGVRGKRLVTTRLHRKLLRFARMEFSLRDPDGSYVTISALSAAER